MKRVGVIGAGSWGTALALLLARKGHEVVLWARRPVHASKLDRSRENASYLPGFPLPPEMVITSDLADVAEAELLLVVVPSHGLREVAGALAPHLSGGGPKAVVSAAKGIENGTLRTMTDVLQEELPPEAGARVAVLSGPSFAREVAADLPTAVTVAAQDHRVAAWVQEVMATGSFRVYTSTDVVGVQLGGALKNVMAVAAGISDGLGFGTNTRAALVTRGLAEMARLGVRLGANPLTFAGLAGLGDLVLTCTGDLSRNRQVGLRLGRGEALQAILDDMNMVAEGVKTSRAARDLAARHGVEMPITEQVCRVLHEGFDPREAVRELMLRPPRAEAEFV
ncbi:NAD(P)-dependent glycerol-3-phosphate dehydrogenase [Dissulfurirhabdus thermomarina]|uniref:Glycerol-3-phosphate dehydrogenase [NAD(P)+] n=1 Tax=Dissulfurirhabdus thermomarina TaxID=1765737 RepID=A0A6N9TSM6_DISTH|nr:NAD(P)H-dependent glycerol-3-phosphate dehydrogenase [Dissulfurirhabdus thermomarina]NDY42744.1 NAD(P)-dependent glycerol-3-phosphate dehydrogenase [Dissulfurirhabdus thermomarina]NMX22454.1 NAD(P)-dependent glycerol-3-phosphate dehydrogenase [Dissulfurirhabdus thermomarina]